MRSVSEWMSFFCVDVSDFFDKTISELIEIISQEVLTEDVTPTLTDWINLYVLYQYSAIITGLVSLSQACPIGTFLSAIKIIIAAWLDTRVHSCGCDDICSQHFTNGGALFYMQDDPVSISGWQVNNSLFQNNTVVLCGAAGLHLPSAQASWNPRQWSYIDLGCNPNLGPAKPISLPVPMGL